MFTFSPFAPGRPTSPGDPGDPWKPCNPCRVRSSAWLWHSGGSCSFYKESVSLTCGPGAPVSPLSPFTPYPGSPCNRTQAHEVTTVSFPPCVSVRADSLTLGPGTPCSPWNTSRTISTEASTWIDTSSSRIMMLYSPWSQGTQEDLVDLADQANLAGISSGPKQHRNDI